MPLSSIVENLKHIIIPTKSSWKGKNGHRWSTIEPQRKKRVPTRNIIHFVPGSNGLVSHMLTPGSCFKYFFSDNMLQKIVIHTNEQIALKSAAYKEKTLTISKTCKEEVMALIGLLVFSGAMKNNHLNAKRMFDPILSGNIYRAIMSSDRFLFLLDCLRFDDKQTRADRKKVDTFAPVRDIWEEFIAICRSSYTPSSYTTLDEQLLAFRGRCGFRMFIPNKPAKYGIKLVMLCDVASKYMIDAEPYLGKGTKTNELPLSAYYIKNLTKSIHGSNRCVTMDNWFTSVGVADELLLASYNLTLVGTLRKNKAEIPPDMLETRQRQPGTSVFCFDKQKTLVKYLSKTKNKKLVILLSTIHTDRSLNKVTKKPEMIHFYNETKFGVDTFDQMCWSTFHIGYELLS
jgi:hypothetical protein